MAQKLSLYSFAASNDLKMVLEELLDVSSLWRELGVALGLRRGKLEEICDERRKDRMRMWEVVSLWLGGSGIESTWRNLIKALGEVGKSELAEALEIKLLIL